MAAFGLFAFGPYRLGGRTILGPTDEGSSHRNLHVEHSVARGAPVVQIIGRERDEIDVKFRFHEAWCDPDAEWARLRAAHASRSPQPLLIPGEAFDGRRFLFEKLDRDIKARTPSGRLAHFTARATFKEDPGGGRRSSGISIGLAFSRGGVSLSISARL